MYGAQAPAAVQTPSWGGLAKDPKTTEEQADKDAAAPKTWRGQGEWQVSLSVTAVITAITKSFSVNARNLYGTSAISPYDKMYGNLHQTHRTPGLKTWSDCSAWQLFLPFTAPQLSRLETSNSFSSLSLLGSIIAASVGGVQV